MTYAVIGGSFLLAGFVKGIVGLGLPTISLALLTAILDLPTAMALLVVPAFCTNLWQGFIGSHLAKPKQESGAFKKTLKRFKNFISQNGLLRTISKTQIEALFILETFGGFGAKAVLSDSNNSLDSIIYHGKSMLTKIIFNILTLKISIIIHFMFSCI